MSHLLITALTLGGMAGSVKTTLIQIAGAIFIVVIIFRLLGHHSKGDYPEMGVLLVTGVIVAFAIYDPNAAVNMFKASAPK